MTGEARKIEGKVLFAAPIVDDGKHYRAAIDHGDGRFTIAKAIPGLSEAEAERTFTMDQMVERATLVFEGNPRAQEIKGLGRQLAAAFLIIMSGIGAVEIGAPSDGEGGKG